MINALVVGSKGYAGMALMRMLRRHPDVKELNCIRGRSRSAKNIRGCELEVEGIRINKKVLEKSDILFTATPSGFAGKLIPLLDAKTRLIDLSDELRPPKPSGAVYGLSELYPNEIRESRIVANPGCYATSIILGLAPLVSFGLINTHSVSVSSYSGYSGAGKKAAILDNPALKGNAKTYKLFDHRHIPEIESVLELERMSFVPTVLDFERGIISIILAEKSNAGLPDLKQLYEEYYGAKPFVQFLDRIPYPSDVRNTNNCLIYAIWDPASERIKIVSAIDNLGKGAASQAIQNMNLMFGFAESAGLENDSV